METSVINMKMSNDPDLVSVIRLTTSGIASKMGFTMEDIEDLKVAISEACTNAIKHSTEKEFEVKFLVNESRLDVEVIDQGIGYDTVAVAEPDLKNPKTSGLGLFIIKSLMDEVEVKSCEECGTVIRFSKLVGVEE